MHAIPAQDYLFSYQVALTEFEALLLRSPNPESH
jgi:hypothetical protein